MSTQLPDSLRLALASFDAMRSELLSHVGQYALVHRDRLLGVFSTWADACKVGYDKVGLCEPFLVKRIEATETVHFIQTPGIEIAHS
jgi:hypothetical protein